MATCVLWVICVSLLVCENPYVYSSDSVICKCRHRPSPSEYRTGLGTPVRSVCVRSRAGPIGPNSHTGPAKLSASILWAQNHRKPVSESCPYSTFSHRLIDLRAGYKILEKSRGPARHVCDYPRLLGPYWARNLPGSLM